MDEPHRDVHFAQGTCHLEGIGDSSANSANTNRRLKLGSRGSGEQPIASQDRGATVLGVSQWGHVYEVALAQVLVEHEIHGRKGKVGMAARNVIDNLVGIALTVHCIGYGE